MRKRRARRIAWLVVVAALVAAFGAELGVGAAAASKPYERAVHRSFALGLAALLKEESAPLGLTQKVLTLDSYSDPFTVEADAQDALSQSQHLTVSFQALSQIPHDERLFDQARASFKDLYGCEGEIADVLAQVIAGASTASVFPTLQAALDMCTSVLSYYSKLKAELAPLRIRLAPAPLDGYLLEPTSAQSFLASFAALAGSVPLKSTSIVTWSLSPPPLQLEGGQAVLPVTSSVTVAVVVQNTGRLSLPRATVSLDLSGPSGSEQKTLYVRLAPRQYAYLTATFSVTAGRGYSLSLKSFASAGQSSPDSQQSGSFSIA